MLRFVRPAIAALAIAAAGSASAQENLLQPSGPPPSSSERATTPAVPADAAKVLDELFTDLKAAKSMADAHGPEQRILRRWNQSGSATVDLLMGWADKAIGQKNTAEALDLLDQVILLKPDFAEGYNRRATVYYLLDDYRRSLADIEVTLRLEPRHFGAMTGLGAILTEIGDTGRAEDVYRRALAVHPQLEAAKTALEKLEKTDKGSPI